MFYQTDYQKVPFDGEKSNLAPALKRQKTKSRSESSSNQCEICGLVNFNAWSLTIHMRRHNNERPAKCSYCSASFVNNSELKSHIAGHTKEKRYKCRFCPKWFTNNSSKYLHEDTHGILQHKCKFCEKTFYSQVERRRHQRTHSREPLSCKFCVKKFATEEFLKRHEQTDHAKSLKCLKCKIKLSSYEELESHKASHKANRKARPLVKKSNEVTYFQDSDVNLSTYFFTCIICSEKFPFRLDLNKHIEAVHPTNKEDIYKFKCSLCNKSFMTKLSLKSHMIGHGPRKHKCPHCDYRSTRGKDLSKHIQTRHSTGKNFKCSECGAVFTHYCTFVSHKLKHGEKKFKCDLCDKAYYVKATLSNHKRISHHSTNPVCDQCGKVFRNIITLRAHQRRVHNRPQPLCLCNRCGKSIFTHEVQSHQSDCSEEKTIKSSKILGPMCAACNITFSVQRDLVDHFKEMHPAGIYQCKFCNKEYLSPEILKRHVDWKHKCDRPILRKHKHIFTLEEKRTMKQKELIPCQVFYECFSCGFYFTTEHDLDFHLQQQVCLDVPMASLEKVVSKGKEVYSITKIYENNGHSQILGDFDVTIIPKSLDCEPVLMKSVSNSIHQPIKRRDIEKKPGPKRRIRKWTPVEVNVNTSQEKGHDTNQNTVANSNGHFITNTNINTPAVNSTNFAPTNIPVSFSDLSLSHNIGVVYQNEVAAPTYHSMYISPSSGAMLHPYSSPDSASLPQIVQKPQLPVKYSVERTSCSGSVVSSQELLKVLQNKSVNVDGSPFIPLNELYEHLKNISGVDLRSSQ